jgi:type II secretory pathway component GspD/PulD (secretin)
MIRVPTLRLAVLALTCAATFLLAVPAIGQQAPATIQPSLTLKDAPVQDVIRLIAKAQGADVVMTDDVQGTVSLEVSQKPPEEILDLICAAKKLYWWKDHGVYVVSATPRGSGGEVPAKAAEAKPLPETIKANKEQVVMSLKYFNAQDLAFLFGGAREPHTDAYRTMQKLMYPRAGMPAQAVGAQTGSPAGAAPDSGVRAKTARYEATNPFSGLSQVTLPGVIEPVPTGPQGLPGQEITEEEALAEEGLISQQAPLEHLLPEGLTTPPVAFSPLNALIVEGTPEAIEEFRKLVELLDVRVPQIMVEAQFVEMRIDDARKFGIDWSWISGQTSIDVTGIAQGGTIGASYSKGKFTALLQALVQNQRARVINAPRLATMNGQPVTFTISQMFFYFTSSSVVQPPGFAGSQVITNEILNYIPVQTLFTVLPQVNGDSSITVDVTTVITDIAGFATSPSGQSIPQTSATTLPTRLRVEDGDTIVMGGLIRKNMSKTQRKVPLLSDIPIIGRALFTGTDYTYSDSELLIFLTAYIIPEKGTTVVGAQTGERVPFMSIPLGK